MQITSTLRFHFACIQMAKIMKTSAGMSMGKGELASIESENWYSQCRNHCGCY